jgi:hypothetical protein
MFPPAAGSVPPAPRAPAAPRRRSDRGRLPRLGRRGPIGTSTGRRAGTRGLTHSPAHRSPYGAGRARAPPAGFTMAVGASAWASVAKNKLVPGLTTAAGRRAGPGRSRARRRPGSRHSSPPSRPSPGAACRTGRRMRSASASTPTPPWGDARPSRGPRRAARGARGSWRRYEGGRRDRGHAMTRALYAGAERANQTLSSRYATGTSFPAGRTARDDPATAGSFEAAHPVEVRHPGRRRSARRRR